MWVWFKLQTLNLVHRTETKGSCKANSSTLVHTPLPALRAGESGQLAKPLSPSAQTYIRSQTQHAQDRTVSAASCLEILRTAHFLSQQQMGLLGAANSGQDGLRNSLLEDTLQSPPLPCLSLHCPSSDLRRECQENGQLAQSESACKNPCLAPACNSTTQEMETWEHP